MPHHPLANVMHYLRRQVDPQGAEETGDDQLLERFIDRRDEAAFEVLVQRHGPMVLGLCRGMLRDEHRADDAFQATFLVLARKAASIHKRQSAASWLYGVAYRIALRARAGAARQRQQERQAHDMSPTEAPSEVDRHELSELLRNELDQLPEKYRAPLVLCYLEGRTVETAARELGWPRGSISKRLARGRDLLRERLTSRGIALSAALLGTALAESAAPAAVPVSLLTSTLKAATLFAAGQAAAGAIPAPVVALAEGVLHAMTNSKMKMLTGVVLLLGFLSGSAGLLYQTYGKGAAPPVVLPSNPRAEVLTWDHWRADLPRVKDAPPLRIYADGAVQVNDPTGPGIAVQGKLTASELQELLRFVVHEQGFFQIDQRRLGDRLRLLPGSSLSVRDEVRLTRTTLRVHADGREHEIRCPDLRLHAEDCSETKQLLTIVERLERLRAWAYAGGHPGLEAAVRLANEELRRQFPDAPLLKPEDLQVAMQQANGTAWLNLERHGVAPDQNPYSFIYARIEQFADKPHVTVRADLSVAAADPSNDGKKKGPPNLTPKPFAEDPTVKIDYPIVYVRVPRSPKGDDRLWMNALDARVAPRGSELVLWHPDGKEEVLVPVKENEAISAPVVSFDGESVFYVKYHDVSAAKLRRDPPDSAGADIYKVHVPTRKIVRLTHQEFTPNLGTLEPPKSPQVVFNLGPCPLPGGKVVFTSDRNAFRAVDLHQPFRMQQLFVMDDDGSNVECIGHLNLGLALDPSVLMDGRILFSTLERQGLRVNNYHQWGIWSIHPDGTNWGPVISAMTFGVASHLQTQLSDGRIVANIYYHGQNTKGFGGLEILPSQAPEGYPAFGPANPQDPRSHFKQRGAGKDHGPFLPHGMRFLTAFGDVNDFRPNHRHGSFNFPSGAPDNHLLCVWGGASCKDSPKEYFDSGIYLIKSGKPVTEPGEMLLIKDEPNYHEIWPRALVSFKRIYGVAEPKRLARLNDGKRCPHLSEGTPFGLVGTSSLYKRESYPYGTVPKGSVTATYRGTTENYYGLDAWKGLGGVLEHTQGANFIEQGSDSALYNNDEVHAIRILMTEPTNLLANRAYFGNASNIFERLRILGEFPVRKFDKSGKQPLDPDGNPDTSFLAKIPADVAWTFQTLDKNGMVLNMAQTWHQLRPGEIRNNCGGCHAHSQKPTEFKLTAAAQPNYPIWDASKDRIPLLTVKKHDQSGKQWDTDNQSGVRWQKGNAVNVEYFRDIKPILERSCIACHTQKSDKPAADLVLDDDRPTTKAHINGHPFPGTYVRLAGGAERHPITERLPHSGYRPPIDWNLASGQSSRFVRAFQSRRSLLAWKIFGKRLDGFHNDDFTTETVPGDAATLQYRGRPVFVWQGVRLRFKDEPKKQAPDFSLTFSGSIMPPPDAVKSGKVKPLTEEDRFTLIRWIDLGCPIDLAGYPARSAKRDSGWLDDDQRPTLALTYPQPGANSPLARLLLGMYDVGTGLDMTSFTVTADFPLGGVEPGQNLASKFKALPDNRWELKLAKPLAHLPRGKLTVSVKDKQGNITKIERTFSVRK